MTGSNRRGAGAWFTPTCSTGKRGYATRTEAKAARRVVPAGESKLTAYRCAECGAFHLGHLPPHVTRGMAPR